MQLFQISFLVYHARTVGGYSRINVPEQIANTSRALSNMHISSKITIDNLTGTENDIDGWFDSFEIKSNAANWTDEIRGLRMPAYLADTAVVIWKTQAEENKYKYQESKTHIIKHFENENTIEQNFYSRRQKETESVLEFYCKLQHLASKIFKASESDSMKKNLLRVFWAGLLPSIRRLVIGSTSPIDIETALTIAKQTEKFVSEENKSEKCIAVASSRFNYRENSSERTPLRKSRGDTPERKFDNDRNSRYDSKDRNNHRSVSPVGDSRQKTPFSDKRNAIKCYGCGKEGHLVRDCRYKSKCDNCGKIGHTKDKCYAVKQQNKNQLNY